MMELGTLPEPPLYVLAALAAVHLAASLVSRVVQRQLDGSRVADRAGADGARPADEGRPPADGRSPPAGHDVERGGTSRRAATAADDPAPDAVRCPDCGAANERGYRFCRACVTELPGVDGRATPAESAWSGAVR